MGTGRGEGDGVCPGRRMPPSPGFQAQVRDDLAQSGLIDFLLILRIAQR